MNSILSYKERGPFGNSNYRGNCSGFVIKDLIQHYYPGTKPKKFIEIFSRWRYWKGCSNKFRN